MNRLETSLQDKWNVEAFYPSLEAWNKDFNRWREQGEGSLWQKINTFRGRVKEGAPVIVQLLEAYLELDRHLTKLYTYAHLRHDEDVSETQHKTAYHRITALCHEFRQVTAWIEPEFLQIDEKDLELMLQDPFLKPYRFYLEKIVRLKPHVLESAQEELLARAAFALDAAGRAFGAFNNADLKFPKVVDGQGVFHELTHGKYLTHLRSPDRTLRRESFQTLHRTYNLWENTLSELIHGEVQKHLFFAKARKFESCLEAALFPHHIDPKVYLGLIETVRAHLPVLHHYLALRKSLLNLDELHLYDLHAPLIADIEMKIEFDEAVQWIIEAVSPLKQPYQQTLRKGLVVDRWVDRYENDQKRSGAYSSGCYDSFPYILMNYHGQFYDMMTLSHEAGHSMHSYLSWAHQPYHDSAYPIFLAEVASTFHEELTFLHLMKNLQDPRQRAYLINQKIEDIRNTFFRQVMFAEFELKLHESAQQGIPLTPAYLKQEYLELNRQYFGPSVIIDEEIAIEWARIPHFYYNFYVYQYATGISAAHALVQKVLKDGPEAYLRFLSSGGSRFPLDILREAGVDMTTPLPIRETLTHFESLVQQLQELTILCAKK